MIVKIIVILGSFLRSLIRRVTMTDEDRKHELNEKKKELRVKLN